VVRGVKSAIHNLQSAIGGVVPNLKSAISNQKSAIFVGLAFFGLYFVTLSPSVLPADNGEFQLAAWKLGIAHPPGYALYTLVGWLVSRFFASPAFALNLLSAILASVTLVVVSRTVRLLTQSTLAGVLAAALLGTSTTFWAQATTANIRMPAALFTALCVSLLVSWSRSRVVGQSTGQSVDRSIGHRVPPSPHPPVLASPRHLVILSFVFALGLGHHPSLAFPGVFFLLFIWLNDRTLIKQPRRWVKPLIAFVLGLLVLAYLPLRGATGGTLANGEAMTSLAQPDKFLDYVLGRGFEGDFFYFITTRPDLLADRVALLPTLFTFQFNPFVIGLVVIGAIRLVRRDWKLALMLIGGIGLTAFVALTYRAPQTVEYLLPAYVLLVIIVGYGLPGSRIQNSESRIQERAASWQRLLTSDSWLLASIFWLLASALVVVQFAAHWPSFGWLQQNDDTQVYAESLLSDAPANALVLSNWHWAGPLWYAQQVEGTRPDVEVQYVFPRGETLAASWLNAIDAGLKANRPVVVDMFFRPEFEASPYFLGPGGGETVQVCAEPCPLPRVPFTPLDAQFDGRFGLIGFNLNRTATSPGEPLSVLIAYRVEQPPDRDYSFFVHLVDGDGRVIGQADRTVRTTRYPIGAAFAERFALAPLTDVPPGDYTLVAGIYSVEAGRVVPLKSGGVEHVTLGSITVQADSRLIGAHGIDLAGGITFVGADTPTGKSALRPGDRLTLDLNFAATRPILRDYVVSVQLTGSGWRVSDDSVPALGAIPTLKWIAGSQVVDRHVLVIPPNASGQATATISLYDAFTQEPLALLDAKLIQQGTGIPIGTWQIEAR
jgi:hypothetical protein